MQRSEKRKNREKEELKLQVIFIKTKKEAKMVPKDVNLNDNTLQALK